jgi:hypothetical protein
MALWNCRIRLDGNRSREVEYDQEDDAEMRRNECTEDLKKPWANRMRRDTQVAGAIELAFLRGEQSGREKTIARVLKIIAKWFSSDSDIKGCLREVRALKDDHS